MLEKKILFSDDTAHLIIPFQTVIFIFIYIYDNCCHVLVQM